MSLWVAGNNIRTGEWHTWDRPKHQWNVSGSPWREWHRGGTGEAVSVKLRYGRIYYGKCRK